jgi:hypothetical protein
MSRLIPILAITAVTLGSAIPALAADYGETDYGMRPSYPDDWQSDEGDPLGFEVGLRYWYSIGTQSAGFGPLTLAVSDQTHTAEVFARIDDYSTRSYVKAVGGYSFAMSGHSDFSATGPTDVIPGRVGYVVADFGYTPFGDGDTFSFGGLVGYQYWNDSPSIGRGEFAAVKDATDVSWSPGSPTYSVPFSSSVDNLDIHALRLGITGKANLGEMFDVNAELAAIPYAWVNGTLGVHTFDPIDLGTSTIFKSSPTQLNGWAYGAAAELLVGFHPTKNLTFRVGGRAWYLTGQLDATFDTATISDPSDSDGDGVIDTAPGVSTQTFVTSSDWASLFRYGALFEMSYNF